MKDELKDDVSACRVPYELDVVWSEPSGKEVLDRKNNLRELCREGCRGYDGYVVERVTFSDYRLIGTRI